MKTITLLAVVAMLLVDLVGSKSSVGGPMTNLLVLFVVMLAVAIHEARSKQRGPLSWIATIAASIIGGFLALSCFSLVMESTLMLVHFEGVLATSDNPLRVISEAAMAVFAVAGSWIGARIVSALADRLVPSAGRP